MLNKINSRLKAYPRLAPWNPYWQKKTNNLPVNHCLQTINTWINPIKATGVEKLPTKTIFSGANAPLQITRDRKKERKKEREIESQQKVSDFQILFLCLDDDDDNADDGDDDNEDDDDDGNDDNDDKDNDL